MKNPNKHYLPRIENTVELDLIIQTIENKLSQFLDDKTLIDFLSSEIYYELKDINALNIKE